jgi:alpha-L-fucosidase
VNINRRTLLYSMTAAGLLAPSSASLFAAAPVLGRPSKQQIAWADLEIGMFVHFAPNTWQDLESDDLSTPLSAINPVKLDTDQWARTALELGAKYIVFVAKHQGGFCMWQTHTTDYGIRNTPWKDGKGDVLAEVRASCDKYGLKLGVYVCPRDDHAGAATGGICKTPELQAKYDAMYREQLTEVFSRYGEMVEIWFDGSSKTDVGDLLAKYQPKAMVFQGRQATIRWVGTEEGSAPYPCWNGIDRAGARSGVSTALDSDPNADTWLPNEVDVSIRRPDWFWSTKNADKVLTKDQLMSIYYRSVGRGAQLLLNLPANRDGLLDAPDVASAKAFGDEVKRRFTSPVAETKGLTLMLAKPTRVDTVVIEEEIALGERIRGYRLEGFAEGEWRPLGEGISVGHKRIQPIVPLTVSGVRLVVTSSAAPVRLKRLAVFDTGVPAPEDWNASSKLWSSNLAGKWVNESFSVDLTKHIKVAGQYALRFQGTTETVTGFSGIVLEQGGVATPSLIKASRTKKNELLLNITGLDSSIKVSGKVLGAEAGSILLERR